MVVTVGQWRESGRRLQTAEVLYEPSATFIWDDLEIKDKFLHKNQIKHFFSMNSKIKEGELKLWKRI